MQTICKECIFAEWSEGVQIGCNFMGRLDKYKDKGLAKIDGHDKWYFTINTLCKACTKIKIGQTLPDNFADIVKKNITPKVDAIIDGEDEEEIKEILVSIKDDGYNKIIACRPTVSNPRLYQELSEIYPAIILSGQVENRYRYEYLDVGCSKSSADYLVIINHHSVPSIPKVVEDYVMIELIDFVAILPEANLNGLVITPKAYKFLGGNFDKSIVDKVKEIPNFESMVLQWNNLKSHL